MKSTLILGLYFSNLHSACMASLHTVDGLQTGVLTWYGYGLASALHKILQEAKPIGATHLSVLCNHEKFIEDFTKPIRLALPEVRKEGRKKIPCGNENQWDVARDLAVYKKWQFLYSDNIPKAKELWHEKFGKKEN